jgi:hypothetical protein
MEEKIKKELQKYQLEDCDFEILSNKDSVLVVRILDVGYVLKIFLNEYRREIDLYRLFNEYEIKTIKLIDFQEYSMLLEDIEASKTYRLATKDDMNNIHVMDALGKWYLSLHELGYGMIKGSNLKFFSEVQELDSETLRTLEMKTEYLNLEFWNQITELLPILKQYVTNNQTITYNDFNYTNMIVSIDFSEAFMFDYNLTGVGLPYFDVRNICSNSFFNSDFYTHFRSMFNFSEVDILVDNLLGHLYTLKVAYDREIFPNWALDSLKYLKNGFMENDLKAVADFFSAKDKVYE